MPIPKPQKGDTKDKYVSRCMGNPTVLKEYPDQKQRAAVCHSMWRRRNNSGLQILRAKTGKVRKEKWNDQDHIVVPVVAIVEGVLHAANQAEPELYLANEFGKHPESWNGRPVVVDHPQMNGERVSANNPEVFEKETLGYIFNTHLDGNKLKLEAWINSEKADERGGIVQETITKLSNGEVTEVSTGIYGIHEPKAGYFNGKKYAGILRDMVPDHLAILSSAKGACSVTDGCGAPRANEQKCTGKEDCDCADCQPVEDTPETRWNVLNHLTEKLGWIFRGNKQKLSDRDTRTALQSALSSKENTYAYVVAVFDNSFVYEDGSGKLYMRDYSISEGTVSISDKPVHVRPETKFVPLKTNEETIPMADAKKVDALINNEATKFTEKEKDWLLTLSDEQLAMLEPEAQKDDPKSEPAPAPAPKTEVKDDGKEKPEVKEAPTEEKPVTLEGYLAGAPQEIQDVLGESLRLRTDRRAGLIKTLSANQACEFTEDELKSMATPMLERLAKLAQKDDFSGRGAPRGNTSGDDNAVPEPPDVFAALSKKQAA